ncbi:pyruvate, phosphate dikinase [Anaerobranca gottschalkii]|uniref:Pyruvate, phosphate dikinase n=1 Tax=Anaerobranca gottschalkii DSM 13577 TaxID=1120990 RepID=A0A1H9Y070_9FIRM|nr:pyruvate, phosphate dikinase [Anaerobranca gottschalkii]SES62141.1 pyruvate phosphate dikinase [Anaerobranca gottschalkii DSM 13577]
MKKYVYLFSEGNKSMKELLGGKGANLAEMTSLGLPVPPGFTITTEACHLYYHQNKSLPEELFEEVKNALGKIEEALGKKFGSTENPLLVSVRSGAPVSMPGMMDTILNLGLNDVTVEALAEETGDKRFAYDCYRRFIQMFSNVVLGIPHYNFERALDNAKELAGVTEDTMLDGEILKGLVDEYKRIVLKNSGKSFPQEPFEQLKLAIKAVFDSWNNPRAIIYRQINKIPEHYGTAVNVQSMVFGNKGNDCGTGVLFTRNPSTGEKILFGEFLVNAQGEDVVAGIRTPQPIQKLKEIMPDIYEEILQLCEKLEREYKDVQDIEFTVEKNRLFILQTRNAKRTAKAAVKFAVDLVEEGLLSREEALLKIDPNQLDKLLHRTIDTKVKLDVIAKGLPASPGAATGKIVFEADEAEQLGKKGEKVLLVRPETTPDDIHGMVEAQGVLTTKGGMTSHAAVVARGMGKPCVCGCEALDIYLEEEKLVVGDIVLYKGDILTIDGTTGDVIIGEVDLVEPELNEDVLKVLSWADELRDLRVRANADTPQDAKKAREFGAEGIGLCRTEHMFMEADRLPIVQKMILAQSIAQRKEALDKLLPIQQRDFYEIFKVMAGLPVTIRLLDPPLHEFLPDVSDLSIELALAKEKGELSSGEIAKREELLKRVKALQEANPMLGHRGCRLAIVFPEIYEMQVNAIFAAISQLVNENIEVYPEIMIPLVGEAKELAILKEMIVNIANKYEEKLGKKLNYTVGTMIELPRACVTADKIAEHAQFFSFGTNDLTQTTLGFSRDDAEGKFLPSYLDQKIYKENPFAVLDREGVGALMKIAVEKGRSTRPELKTGICGEHGGEPSSIEFCHKLGLNYVSCSPYRVPIARLAAAQSKIKG